VDDGQTIAPYKVHLISHVGKDETVNSTFASLDAHQRSVTISDGRYADQRHGMISRMCCKVPLSQAGTDRSIDPEQNAALLQRLNMFLANKFPKAQHATIGSAISLSQAVMDEAGKVSITMVGDYVCLHSGADGVSEIFGSHRVQDGPTVREVSGEMSQISVLLKAGERLLVCNSLFDLPQLSADTHTLLTAATLADAAKAIWQNASIRGVSGNVVLAVIEFAPDTSMVSGYAKPALEL
jgi:hypothetical protein